MREKEHIFLTACREWIPSRPAHILVTLIAKVAMFSRETQFEIIEPINVLCLDSVTDISMKNPSLFHVCMYVCMYVRGCIQKFPD
jgi:hypothetical protein